METVQLPSAAVYETKMSIHTLTVNTNIGIPNEFQKNISDPMHKNGVMDQGKYRKRASKKSGRSMSIIFKTTNIYHTHQ